MTACSALKLMIFIAQPFTERHYPFLKHNAERLRFYERIGL